MLRQQETSSYYLKFTHLLRLLLLVFLCLFVKVGWGQSPQNTPPSYTHLDHADLPTVSSSELNSDDLTIAIATGPQNFVYVLTFGSGVQKRDADGNLVNSSFITGLDSPFDIAVDDEGFIYIADFYAGGDTWADNGQVKIYDSNGNYVRSILTSYFRPMGIDVDENYVYIAEYNDGKKGPESTPSSRIRIVDKATGNAVKVNNNVTLPYRIAADSRGNVYVSQEGGGSPGVYIFDSNLSPQRTLPNIQSPGSIVIDDFDFIHVIEYAGKIDFGEFITSTDDIGYLFQVAGRINDGIKNQVFGVKIFDSSYQLKTFYKTEIHFPLDIAFNHCDRMYIDDSEINGYKIFGTFFPTTMEFDLEFYKRTPAFDITPPEISCPADISVTAEAGQDYATVTYPDPTASDACGVTLERISGLASGSNFPVGTNTVEYKATDSFGNESTCSFLVEVSQGDQPPVFDNCPSAEITQFNDPGQCGAIVTFDTPTASDENGSVAVIRTDSGPASGEMFPVGTTTVVFTATDDQQNSTTCSFDVTVVDGEAPIIQCGESITVTAEPGNDYAVVNFTEPSVADNCAVLLAQTGGLASGSQFPIGTSTITYMATDQGNNTDTCQFDVIVKPADIAPEFTNCPSDISVDADSGRCGAIVDFTPPTASDENGNVEVQRADNGPASGEEFPVGTTKVIFEATDAQNNTSSCTFDITVSDKQAPTINCPGPVVTLSPDQNGDYIIPDYTSGIISDNCDDVSALTIIQNPEEGTSVTSDTTVEITAEDSSGNTSETCSFTVQLEAQPTPPVAECNSFELPLDGNGQASITAQEVYGGNDSSLILDINRQNFDCSDLGPNPVVLTVTDPATNLSDNCTATITVVDRTAPIINCPGPVVSLSPDQNGDYIIPDYTSGIISDNCDNVSALTITQNPAEGTSVTSDSTVEITAEDSSGNISETCSFTVQLEAQATAPEANCRDLFPNLGADGQVSITAEDIYNGDPGNLELSIDKENFDCSDLGANAVELKVTDPATGLFSTCIATVTIVDEIAPSITCPYDQTENYDPSQGFVLPDYTSFAAAADNCSVTSITQEPAAGTNISTDTQITLTAKDASGNENSCTFMVHLSQEEVLQISCPGDMTASLNADCLFEVPDYRPMASVNMASAELSQSPEPGDMISESTAIKLIAAKDGQTDICTFNLTLKDTIAPVAQCLGTYELTLNADGTASVSAEDLDSGSSDNCGISEISLDKTSFTTAELGENQVTLTVTDSYGNTDSCTTTVTVKEGTAAPEYQCVGQLTLPLNQDGNANLEISDLYEGNVAASNFTLDRSEFTCDDLGQQSVRLSYYENGNLKSYCDIDVYVIDNMPPEVLTRDLTIDLDENGTASIAAEDLDAGSTDNCGGQLSFSLSKSNFSCNNTGSNEVTLIVTDESGNSASSTASVFVNAAPGICSQQPAPEVRYLYIWPNPNNGHFQIAVPSDLTVKEVLLYDTRGRFIGGKTFSDDAIDYEVNLSGLQDAVYHLIIQTGSRGRLTRKIIVRN